MRYAFDEFELDVSTYELRSGGIPVSIQPKVFDVLRELVEHRDRVVSKEELLDAVWSDVNVADSAVTWCITHLRKALGQEKSDNHPIETIRGRGYRFNAVVRIQADSMPPSTMLKPATESEPEPFVGRDGTMRRMQEALARAIATDPEIIFFDEPTTGLDPIMADVINDLIVNTVKSMGATTLSITHDIASARKIADRIAMIHDGRIIWSGPVSEIDDSGNALVDQFINGRADGPIQMQVAG